MTEAYEQLMPIVEGRRSVRRFSPEPLSDALLDRLFEAARWAPSPGNRQAFRFWLVTAPERKRRMAEEVQAEVARLRDALRPEARADGEAYLAHFGHFDTAPAVVAALYRRGTDLLTASIGTGAGAVERGALDALAACAAATQNLLLAAHSLGLGACWMTGPLVVARGLAAALEIPEGWELAALIPIGHPAESPEAPPRRPLARLVRRLD